MPGRPDLWVFKHQGFSERTEWTVSFQETLEAAVEVESSAAMEERGTGIHATLDKKAMD